MRLNMAGGFENDTMHDLQACIAVAANTRPQSPNIVQSGERRLPDRQSGRRQRIDGQLVKRFEPFTTEKSGQNTINLGKRRIGNKRESEGDETVDEQCFCPAPVAVNEHRHAAHQGEKAGARSAPENQRQTQDSAQAEKHGNPSVHLVSGEQEDAQKPDAQGQMLDVPEDGWVVPVVIPFGIDRHG